MSERLIAGDPDRIGEFWLSGRLGAGGQGVVYDAYAPDGTRVAIKVLHSVQDSRELELMAAEARAAQRVASFCTARILRVRLEPPQPYIVSEYIDGLSLQDTVIGTDGRPGRLFTGDDLVRLGVGIATALTAIHQAKVVHRDVKPGNVMLGPDGPRLIDFGIARVLDTHSATEGGFAGTLRYTAPEVYAGQRAGAEADVFAWGAVMVFAATGRHAFPGSTLPEIAYQIHNHHPDLSALPETMRPLVAAALAKNPLERPSARTILAALTEDPTKGAGDPQELVASGAAMAGLHFRWEPGDPALGKLAEDAYAALSPYEQALVPEVFLRCVVPGEDENLTVRSVPLAELLDRDDPAEAQALEHVVRAFDPLLTVTGDGADQQVVLTRPAVLRAWPRLRSRLESERERLAVHQRVRRAAHTWADHGRRRADVLTGAHLDEALHWATAPDRRPSPNRLERGLLDASTREQTARSRRIRAVAVVLAVTTVLSLVTTGWAVRAQQASADQRDIAASRQLAAQSRQFSGTAPDKAALLAVAAHTIRETPESRTALMNVVTDPARGGLDGYKGDPLTVAADRSGRLLAIGNKDGTVGLWDVRRHRQVGGLLRLFERTRSEFPMTVAISPDGRTLAAAGTEWKRDPVGFTIDEKTVKGTVRLWDVATRRHLGDLPVSAPLSVVFASDGRSVAVDDGEEVSLWDVRTRRRRSAVPSVTDDEKYSLSLISPDASIVVNGEESSGVTVWDLTRGRRLRSLPVKGQAVALSPDARILATEEDDEESTAVHFWDTRTGKKQGATIHPPDDREVGPFSPDGRIVTLGSEFWSVESGIRLGAVPSNTGEGIQIVAFAGERTAVAVAESDFSRNTVLLWDITVHQPGPAAFTAARPSGGDRLHRQGISPDLRKMATLTPTGRNDAFYTWDVATGKQTQPPVAAPVDSLGRADATSMTVRPDGRTIVFAGLDDRILLWDPEARRWHRLDSGRGGQVNAMAISPDGRILATGRGHMVHDADGPVDGRVELWDLDRRTPIGGKPLFSSGEEVRSLAFSPDGRTLAAGIGSGIRLLNVGDGRATPPINGLTGAIGALAFSPDGRTLAAGGHGVITLWDVRTRRQIGVPIGGHEGPITALAFGRDGSILASGAEDGAVKLWDVAEQSQIGAPLAGHFERVAFMAFDSGMKTLITSDDKAVVRQWNIAMPPNPTAIACSIAGRALTRAEWRQYVPPGIDFRDVCPSLK